MDRRRSTAAALPRGALALALVALVLRIGLIAATDGYAPVHDALDYDRHARSIAAGDGYPPPILVLDRSTPSAFRPPLYPHTLALVYKVAPGTQTAGRLAGALLGAISVLLLFVIADRLWGRPVAWVAASLSAVFPPLVALSGALTVESLFIPIELGLVLAVLGYTRTGALRWAALGGALCGLAWLTRANGFILALPLVWGIVAARSRPTLRGSLGISAIALVIAALIVAPWAIRNAIAFDGKFIPVSDTFGYGLAGTYNDQARSDPEKKGEWRPPNEVPDNVPIFLRRGNDEAEIDDELGEKALRYIADHPGYAIEAPLLNGYRLLNPLASSQLREISYDAMNIPDRLRDVVTYSYLAVALLAGLGAVLAVRRRELGPLWLWSIPILVGLSFAILSGEPRYRTTLDPFFLLLAAVALVRIAELRRA